MSDVSSLQVTESDRLGNRRFALIAALIATLLALVPFFQGLLSTPAGGQYLGFQYATDDHMVYSAWMWQAKNGQFFFDNRFAVDAQPGLTVHLYFWLLGLISHVTGLVGASVLARAVFSALFVWMLYRLLERVNPQPYFVKLGLSLGVLGGGLGFLVWHNFGEALVRPEAQALSGLVMGRLPIDVWQPEAFVFPSMLTNGLFMVSLCLILGVFLCVMEARDSWRPVLPGFLSMALLMNIHSYDVLLVTFVLVGFLVMQAVTRQISGVWVGRAVVIGLGAVPPALWFVHVLRNDPVFQSRAATETFSPNFAAVFFGLAALLVLALVGHAFERFEEPAVEQRRRFGVIGFAVLLVLMVVGAGTHAQGYWLEMGAWAGLFVLSLVALALMAGADPWRNLLLAWGVIGLVAPYFPQLFQRKLLMGISVPWAILAAWGLWTLLKDRDRGLRNLSTALAILLLAATSLRWIVREREYIAGNVSRTTVHPVYLTPDASRAVSELAKVEGRRVVLAMPGVALPGLDEQGQRVPDVFQSPYLPDLNPVLSGLTGAYSYAGHWSETPEYLKRRDEATRFFLRDTPDAFRQQLIESAGVTHVVAPVPGAFPELPLADLGNLGQVVSSGTQFQLIRVRG